MSNIPLNTKIDNDHQSIEELWISVAKLSDHVKNDNDLEGKYPLHIRVLQLTQLKSLVKCIEDIHTEEEQCVINY